MKKTQAVTGYFMDEKTKPLTVTVALYEWDGEENEADNGIFYYAEKGEIKKGGIIAGNFFITDIEN